MAKQKSHLVAPQHDTSALFRIRIDPREVERKIRKPLPPPGRTHRSAKAYQRKPKHPHRTGDE